MYYSIFVKISTCLYTTYKKQTYLNFVIYIIYLISILAVFFYCIVLTFYLTVIHIQDDWPDYPLKTLCAYKRNTTSLELNVVTFSLLKLSNLIFPTYPILPSSFFCSMYIFCVTFRLHVTFSIVVFLRYLLPC